MGARTFSLILLPTLQCNADCDSWVASYPAYWFGNLFTVGSLTQLLADNPVRKRFHERPIALVGQDCMLCHYLALWHGGCPVRAFSVHGTLFEKDPHCALYRAHGHCRRARRPRCS